MSVAHRCGGVVNRGFKRKEREREAERMGLKVELFKMTCYLMFPLTAFMWFSRPGLFGQNRAEIRKDIQNRMLAGRGTEESRLQKYMEFQSGVRAIQEKEMVKSQTKKLKKLKSAEKQLQDLESHLRANGLQRADIDSQLNNFKQRKFASK